MARNDDKGRDKLLVEIDPEDLRDAAAHAAAALEDAGDHVGRSASARVKSAIEWAEPLARDVHNWLTPRMHKAWSDSVVAAAPHVENFAGKATTASKDAHDRLVPAAAAAGVKAGESISAAHGKLVEEFLPRAVALVTEAAERRAAAVARHHAVEAAEAVAMDSALHFAEPRLEAAAARRCGSRPCGGHGHGHHGRRMAVVAAEAVAEPVHEHHRKRKLAMLALLAAGAAGYHFWHKAQPQHDPWAEPFEDEEHANYAGDHADYYGVAGDTAERIGAVVGSTVAYGREAGEKLSEWTRESVGRVRGRHAAGRHDDGLDSVRDTFLDGPVDDELLIVEEIGPKHPRVTRIVDEAKAKVGPEAHKLVDEAKAAAEVEAHKLGEIFRAKGEAAAHKAAEEAKVLTGEAKVAAEAEAHKLLAEAKTKGAAEGRKLIAEVTTKAEEEVKKLIASGKAAHAKHEAEKGAAEVETVEVVEVEPVVLEPVTVVTEVAEPVVKVREI